MKKNYSLLTVISIALVMGACQSNDFDAPLDIPDDDTISEEYSFLEKSLNDANILMSILDGNTRNATRKISSVEPLVSDKTRNESNPKIFVINYEDSNGFAILSDDPRLASVLAISNEGQLSLSDTIFNKGLAQFIRETIYTVEMLDYIDSFFKNILYRDVFIPNNN